MGGTSTSQQTQSSTTAPWTNAQPALGGILGQLNPLIAGSGLSNNESSALGHMYNVGSEGNPYAGQIGANATSLLNGGGAMNQAGAVNQNYQNYQAATNPLASNTNYDPMQTPGIGNQLSALTDQITGNVNGQFAAAGRSGSGYNQKALGQGLTAGLAPILTNQYNQNVQNQLGAAQNLYNAGNANAGLLSGMQQQANANGQVGTQAATDAQNAQLQPFQTQLAASQAQQQIPAQNLGLLAQIGIPIGGLGGQSTGQSNGTQQASDAQQFGQIFGGLGGLLGNFGTGKAFPSIL